MADYIRLQIAQLASSERTAGMMKIDAAVQMIAALASIDLEDLFTEKTLGDYWSIDEVTGKRFFCGLSTY